ncbi:MAG: NAD(P)/FAD-dependent oxidoreductase [Chlorobiales bacterium]|nr:NAD(P)/FAD-dependent oxidoreductase [Chlorobiales bacterium]
MTQPSSYDLIVIGSGIGGLTVASLMAQMKNWRVLVLERHFKLGGFTHSFTRPGRRSWDVGLHYVGDMEHGSLTCDIFNYITRRGVSWVKMPSPFEKFVYPDFTFEVPDTPDAYQAALIKQFPEEKQAIEQYFKDVRTAAEWFGRNVFAKSFHSPFNAIIKPHSRTHQALALSTTAEYLNTRFQNPQLKAVLTSQWADYGLPPSESAFAIHSVIVMHYLHGGYYPLGGAGRIAESVEPVIREKGGACLVSHTVSKIIIKDGKAVGVKARKAGKEPAEVEFCAPIIVSDAGAYTTFCQLVPESIPIDFRPELRELPAGHGVVSLYLAFKECPSKLGFRGENHWIYAGYDHDALLQNQNALLEGHPGMCYISFPSLKDPESESYTAEVISFLNHEEFAKWKDLPWKKRGEEYEALKNRIAESILCFIEEHYPGFKALVDYCEVSTPLTVESFTGHLNGSIYGIPATPTRFKLPWLRVTTPIKNLYLTGADVSSLGIIGGMMGGVATAGYLQGNLGFIRIVSVSKKFRAVEKAEEQKFVRAN